METELKDLVGRKITRVYVNQEYLKFDTDGPSYTYSVDGDCCSHSYFYDFYGVANLLENGKITEIKGVELHPTDLMIEDTSDDIKVYGYQITTESERGYGPVTAVFSFRNSSNGYYGGDISSCENRDDIPELKRDVVEIKENV